MDRALSLVKGTTSAYAENTLPAHQNHYTSGNYLRVRGEYSRVRRSVVRIRELPPRTRRIRSTGHSALHTLGTTSAYAENTVGCQAGGV